jgi:D-alanyl-D-alanine carboxypeptidase/D-alanyl-D-alanine-endopeptidase (penicillin-binding protein 4)
MKLSFTAILVTLISIQCVTASADSLLPAWNKKVKQLRLNKSMQAYCYASETKILNSANLNKKIRLASLTKLATSYWALDELGFDYRFKTRILISKDHIHISGGSDPYFVTENLFYMIAALNSLNIKSVKTISFDERFFVNWSPYGGEVKDYLKVILNTRKWPRLIKAIYNDTKDAIQKYNLSLYLKDIEFKVDKIQWRPSRTIDSKYFDSEITLYSNSLLRILKEMNVFSSNFIADTIYKHLGGELEFNTYMQDSLGFKSSDTYFYSGSGLGDNYTTCLNFMILLRELNSLLFQNLYHPFDLMGVPIQDGGTLEYRMGNSYSNSVAAKTGTLNDISSFAGMVYTQQGIRYFAFLNETRSLSKARFFQDEWLKKLMAVGNGPKLLVYDYQEYHPLEDVGARF